MSSPPEAILALRSDLEKYSDGTTSRRLLPFLTTSGALSEPDAVTSSSKESHRRRETARHVFHPVWLSAGDQRGRWEEMQKAFEGKLVVVSGGLVSAVRWGWSHQSLPGKPRGSFCPSPSRLCRASLKRGSPGTRPRGPVGGPH